jgi:predicted GNAT superfamily acetyltransferase
MTGGLQDAERYARDAAARGGVSVAMLEDGIALRTGVDVLNRVWRADPTEPVITYPLLRTYVFSGNFVSGAFRGGQLVGVAVGFFGADRQLHSDLVGVLPSEHGTGVGFALKQHQRAWAIRHGLTEVRWMFDPLIRRNGRFNLHRLGASAVAYLPDFYGRLTDGLNALDDTDRLAVSWAVTSDRAALAARAELPEVTPDVLAGAAVVVDREGNLSGPRRGATVRRVAVPHDIESLTAQDREGAARWRRAVRTALTEAFSDGYQIADFSTDGSYVLRRNDRARNDRARDDRDGRRANH